MKKLIVLLLSTVLCLSFVACNSNENAAQLADYEDRINELEEMLEKQDDLLDRLLAEIERAHSGSTALQTTAPNTPVTTVPKPETAPPDDTEPEIPLPQYQAVEITLDNWQDYFELYEVNNFIYNSFGEFERWTGECHFGLKDGIEIGTDNNTVAFECKYTVDRIQYTVDLDTQTVIYEEIVEPAFWTRQQVHGMGWYSIYYVPPINQSVRVFGCNLNQSTTNSNGKNDTLKVNNFELIRIEGTIYIAQS